MSDSPNTDDTDELFNEAFSVLDTPERDIENRLKDVLELAVNTNLDVERVVAAYGGKLRAESPLEGKNRRAISLLTAADRQGIDVEMGDFIDAEIEGETGKRIITTAGKKDDPINIIDNSSETPKTDVDGDSLVVNTDDETTDPITLDIDFSDRSAVEAAAVTLYNNDSLNYQERRQALVSLLDQARNAGLDIESSDLGSAIQAGRKDTGTEIDESTDTDETDESTDTESKTGDGVDPNRAKITISNWEVSSTGVHAGDTVEIRVTLENNGETAGLKDIKIKKNHEVIETHAIEVEPGDSRTETFRATLDTGGKQLLQVNDENPVQITVLLPGDLSVTSLEPNITEIAPDTPIELTATIENTGDVEDTLSTNLAIDGYTHSEHSFTVPGNETITETFSVEFDTPGTYSVSLGSYTQDVTVLRPASVNVTDYTLSSTGIETNEELSVSVDIENAGDLPGSIAVALYADGSAVETKSITVEGNDTTTTTFTTSFDRTGTHEVTINNKEQTDVTVLKPASAHVTGFHPSNTEIHPDESLSLSVETHNSGDLSTEFTIAVSIDGEIEHTEPVSIDGNEQREFSIGPNGDIQLDFTEHLTQSGSYTIAVNDLPGQKIDVLEPAELSVRYYGLSEETVDPGDAFEIDVEVENTGDISGDITLEFYRDDEQFDSETITVDGNSDKRGSFEYTFSDPGEYTIQVNELSPTTLHVRNTGTFEITKLSLNTDSSHTYHTGDDLSIDVTAVNEAGLSTEHTLELALDGEVVETTPMYLNGGETATKTLAYTLSDPGDFVVSVDEETIDTIAVSVPVNMVSLDNEEYNAAITQCIKTKDNGDRCSRDVSDGDIVCWQHEEYLDTLTVKEVDACLYVDEDGESCTTDAEDGGLLCTDHNPLDEAFTKDTPSEQDVDSSPTTDREQARKSAAELTPSGSTSPTDTTKTQPPQEQTQRVTPNELSERGVDSPAKHTRIQSYDSLTDNDGLIPDVENSRVLVNFDFVLDEDDEYVPESVNASGMIVDDEEYIGIAKVEPRSWSIHTPEEKQQIISQYKSLFLEALDFPVQIVCYPTEFDISEHIKALERLTDSTKTRDDESYLLNVGREFYPMWLRDYIASSQMKQRNFYIIVRVKPDHLNQFRGTDDGLIEGVENRAPQLAGLLNRLSPGSDNAADVTKKDCLVELQDRLQRIQSSLSPMGVQVEALRSRDKVMSVLYEYYNNEHPITENFDVSTRSEYDPTLRIDDDDPDMDALTDIHYEEFGNTEETN